MTWDVTSDSVRLRYRLLDEIVVDVSRELATLLTVEVTASEKTLVLEYCAEDARGRTLFRVAPSFAMSDSFCKRDPAAAANQGRTRPHMPLSCSFPPAEMPMSGTRTDDQLPEAMTVLTQTASISWPRGVNLAELAIGVDVMTTQAAKPLVASVR